MQLLMAFLPSRIPAGARREERGREAVIAEGLHRGEEGLREGPREGPHREGLPGGPDLLTTALRALSW